MKILIKDDILVHDILDATKEDIFLSDTSAPGEIWWPALPHPIPMVLANWLRFYPGYNQLSERKELKKKLEQDI